MANNGIVTYGNQRILTDSKSGTVYQLYSNSAETETYITNPDTGKKHGTIRKNKNLETAKSNANKARSSTAKAKENKADTATAKQHLKDADDYLEQLEKDLADCHFAENIEAARKAQEAVKKAEESDDESFSGYVDEADQQTNDAADKVEESADKSFTVYDADDAELYDVYDTEVLSKNDSSTYYLNLKDGTVTDAEGNTQYSFTNETPGPGSEDLTFLDKYTYRQFLGLNDVLADMCQNILVSTDNDFSGVNAPGGVDTKSGKSASFTANGTEYHIVGDTEDPNRIHLLKRTNDGFEYYLTYDMLVDGTGKVRVSEVHWEYSNDTKEWRIQNIDVSKYVLSKVTRSDGKLSYWEVLKIGVASAFAALTPPLPLTSKYEDCEERLSQIYNKNNQKTSTTAATAVEQSEAKTWNWPSAQVTFSSLSGTGVVESNTSTSSSSSSSSASSWSWVNTSKLQAMLGDNKKSSSSTSTTSSGSSLAEKAKSALGAVSELGKKMVTFFNKDAKTAKGEDLKKEEPLSVPDMSKETQALALASKNTPPLVAKGARDAVLISTAIERQKVAYGKGRQSYQQEHQSATEIRKTRLQYRQANIAYCINMGAGINDTSGQA